MFNFQILLTEFSGFSVGSPWGSPATCCLGFSVGFFRVLFSFFFWCVKGQNYVPFVMFIEFIFRVLRWFPAGFSSNLLLGVLCGVLAGSLLFLVVVFEGTELCPIFDFC